MTRRRRPASTLLLLATVLVLAACGGGGEVAGGADDLPGPVPADVEYAQPPASALAAPDFDAELVDGTAVRGSELWSARPWLFVFTASYCDRCREIHRAAAEAVAGTDGAVAMLGIAGTDDGDAADYADELDLGSPLAVASERVWLSYAAREPGLVVLVARGGKVVRGWPGGAKASELAPALQDLVE
ncbi:MAG: TlpA family protein disulfide reductase [Nocardioidaceae bacterium]